jgi:hypothetical protein
VPCRQVLLLRGVWGTDVEGGASRGGAGERGPNAPGRGPGAHTLAVGCPFCVVMLIEASRGAGEWIQVLDVAEIFAERRLEGGAVEPAVL